MKRVCSQCGNRLSQGNLATFCFACIKKRREQDPASNDQLIDAQGAAYKLGLSAESVKRLARKGKLPPRVPEVRKWLWDEHRFDTWMEGEGQTGDVFRLAVRGIASNLRKCRDDLAIRLSYSDEIGSQVYGQEDILGTGDAGRVGLIKLVPVDKSIALNALGRLPRRDFPELIGITDWANLTYGKATDSFLARLEAYF